MAFMMHLSETGQPLDDAWNYRNIESSCCLTEAHFTDSISVPMTMNDRARRKIVLYRTGPRDHNKYMGTRTGVVV